MTVPTSLGGTGNKPKRSTSSNPTLPLHDQFLDLNASFSYGSEEEEDVNHTTGTSPKALSNSMGSPSTTNAVASLGQTSSPFNKGGFGRSPGSIGSSKGSGKMFARRRSKSKITVSLPKGGRDFDAFAGSRSGSSRFLSLSQKEKMKRAAKLMQQRQDSQEAPVNPHMTLADLVQRSDNDGKKLYNDSWRSRTKDNSSSDVEENEQQRDQDDSVRDDSSRSLFDCILAAITSGGGCGDSSTATPKSNNGSFSFTNIFDDDRSYASTEISGRESSNASTTSTTYGDHFEDNMSISDKYATPLSEESGYDKKVTLDSCIEALIAGKWNVLLRSVASNPSVLSKKSPIHRNKTLLHILSGQQIEIPVMVLVTMINLCPQAVSQTDHDGCIPLHHMVFTGGKDNLVKILLESWADGTKVKNVDGDLPLHVSVWAGKG